MSMGSISRRAGPICIFSPASAIAGPTVPPWCVFTLLLSDIGELAHVHGVPALEG